MSTKGNDHQFRKLLIGKQISVISTIENAKRTERWLCMIMWRSKGLSWSPSCEQYYTEVLSHTRFIRRFKSWKHDKRHHKKNYFAEALIYEIIRKVLSTGLNARATRSGSLVELLTLCLFFTEMLQFRKQKSLAAQAMHELGNIMFHSGNIRFVLDCDWWVFLVIVNIFRRIHDCRLCFRLVASLSVLYNWYISLRLWLVLFNWKTCLVATMIILVIVTVMTIILVMMIVKVIVMIIYLWY